MCLAAGADGQVMTVGSQLEEMRSGRQGLAGRGPHCCRCQLGWMPSPRSDAKPSNYMDSRATEQKKAFFHQLGRTTGLCKLCVKLRSASQWLNSAHLAVLAFRALVFSMMGSWMEFLFWSITQKKTFNSMHFEIYVFTHIYCMSIHIYSPTNQPTI